MGSEWRSTLGWLQAECCCRAQENMSVARAAWGIQADPLPQAWGAYLQRHRLWMGASWQRHQRDRTARDRRGRKGGGGGQGINLQCFPLRHYSFFFLSNELALSDHLMPKPWRSCGCQQPKGNTGQSSTAPCSLPAQHQPRAGLLQRAGKVLP